MGAIIEPKELSKKHRKKVSSDAKEDIFPEIDNSLSENEDNRN